MDKITEITKHFVDVETAKEHSGYFCNVGEALTIVILGSFCRLQNVNQIHQLASSTRVSEFLSKNFGIDTVPCYYWLLCLFKIIVPRSFNQCFMNWVQSFLPEGVNGLTLSFDGKTIRSTEKMGKYSSPLHIVSAHIAELGITFGQQTVDGKSNEISAVQSLLGAMQIEDCLVVADSPNCQEETANATIDGKADYLLGVKDNHGTLKKDLEDYVQDDCLRKGMDTYRGL
ncbi:ISAs1 family transposase [Lachnospiraceae bacterium ZAX-1]